ncbi:hypothetical protein IP90_00274 [Luteimonas cucumeris]|uniref:Uncharacterized protein n=1 Tax=Luteimonas cucumeris TaxID=985012 RepID=A0A562LEA1_9GAMM|nr:hypothetical protein [Luteimonas cucumeris]TWI06012.1 hypothetical protein IP90_00274 [Luteimonas cucumeris]
MRLITATLIGKRYSKNGMATGRAAERKIVSMRICEDFIPHRIQNQEFGDLQSSWPSGSCRLTPI